MAPGRQSLKRSNSVAANRVIQKKVRMSENEPTTNGVIATTRQVREPGIIMVFGDGDTGQLGLTMDVTEKSRPAVVPNVENIIDVAAGGMHTVCLTANHSLITFGCNDEGALGRDTNEEGSEAIPGPVEIPGKVVQISAGDSHTAALLDNGTIYIFGTFRDHHGSLGLLKANVEKLPILLESKMKFTKIASGCHHLALLGVDGNIYTVGSGEQGQLGRLSERQATRDCRQGSGQLLTPHLIRIKQKYTGKFVDIWTGSYNTLAKDVDGNIHVWGLNNYKQLGADEDTHFHPVIVKSFKGHTWTKISGGEHHTLCLDSKGDVYVLGRKEYGRLGLGQDSEDAIVPTKVEVCPGKKVVGISSGSFASFALVEDGSLYSWGQGSTMLGVGDEDDRWNPTLVKSKQLENRKIVQVESGGQHTVVLVHPSS
uniref:Regulator of chromosome condensation n=2 Tax=Lygus hesperus TaxID=30085 RepID=A0A146M3S4_LYGHE